MNGKRIIALIFSFSLILNLFQAVSFASTNVNYDYCTKDIVISGQTESGALNANSHVVIAFKDKVTDEIMQLEQTECNTDGIYSVRCRVNADILENSVIYVKAGDSDITNSVTDAFSYDYTLHNVEYDEICNGDEITLKADVTDIYDPAQNICFIGAVYDDKNMLINAKTNMVTFNEPKGTWELNCVFNNIPLEHESKIFVWRSISNPLPLANTVKAKSESLEINFGGELEDEYTNGFSTLTGDTQYSRYINSVNELPEYVPQIEPAKVDLPVKIFVSPNGDDTNTGSILSPLKTLQAALNMEAGLTENEKSKGVTIYLREGKYYVNSGAVIREENNVGEGGYLCISSYNGEKVDILGGQEIPVSKLKLAEFSGGDTSRINKSVYNRIYCVDYDELGISAISGFYGGSSGSGPDLYYNNKRMTLARYPNASYDIPKAIVQTGIIENQNIGEKSFTDAVFIPTDKKPFTWLDTGKIALCGQLCISWASFSTLVSFDAANNTVIAPPGTLNWGTMPIALKLINNEAIASHYYYCNVLEELDMPGEWCADDINKKVYFCPENGVLNADDSIIISTPSPASIFDIQAANGLVVNGIDVSNAYDGVSVTESENVLFQNCNIFSVIHGVKINECKKTGIIRSKVFNSSSGIEIIDKNALYSLIPAENFVQNCHISNCVGSGVIVTGCREIVSHNLLDNFWGDGIHVVASTGSIIESNELTAGVLQGNEGCHIYLGGNYISTGNHVRYNYFHDSSKLCGSGEATDDLGEGTFVYKNIFKNLNGAAGANGGDNNVFDSNVVINCGAQTIYSTDSYESVDKINSQALCSTDSPLMGEYYNNANIYVWRARYPYIVSRAEKIRGYIDLWKGGKGDTTSENIAFYRNPTGTYAINNVFVNNTKGVNLGNGAASYTLTDIDYSNSSNIRQVDGNDYNVVANNITLDSFDITSLPYYSTVGVYNKTDLSFNMYSDRLKIYYMGEYNSKLCGTWESRLDCNYYVVTVATDKDFNNIIKEEKTYYNSFSMQYTDKDVYYIKITGYSNNDDSQNSVVCDSEIYIYES